MSFMFFVKPPKTKNTQIAPILFRPFQKRIVFVWKTERARNQVPLSPQALLIRVYPLQTLCTEGIPLGLLSKIQRFEALPPRWLLTAPCPTLEAFGRTPRSSFWIKWRNPIRQDLGTSFWSQDPSRKQGLLDPGARLIWIGLRKRSEPRPKKGSMITRHVLGVPPICRVKPRLTDYKSTQVCCQIWQNLDAFSVLESRRNLENNLLDFFQHMFQKKPLFARLSTSPNMPRLSTSRTCIWLKSKPCMTWKLMACRTNPRIQILKTFLCSQKVKKDSNQPTPIQQPQPWGFG